MSLSFCFLNWFSFETLNQLFNNKPHVHAKSNGTVYGYSKNKVIREKHNTIKRINSFKQVKCTVSPSTVESEHSNLQCLDVLPLFSQLKFLLCSEETLQRKMNLFMLQGVHVLLLYLWTDITNIVSHCFCPLLPAGWFLSNVPFLLSTFCPFELACFYFLET